MYDSPRRSLLLLHVAAITVFGCPKPPAAPAVNGKLTVLVRPPDRRLEPIPIDEPGALPAQTGGAMYLEAQLEKPAFIYLIWIDAGGKAKPLYPWNNETIEQSGFNKPPPVRRATNRVFSPMLGHDWKLDGPPGTETVLMLIRATALPENVDLAQLFADLPPPPPPASPHELRTYKTHSRDNEVVGMRQNAGSDLKDDEPLKAFLRRLAEHFDAIHAVRFAHEDPK